MTPTTATTVMTFLTSSTGSIQSDAFKQAFNIILHIMLMDWIIPDRPADARRAVHDLHNFRAVMAGTGLRNTDNEQLLTFLLCMLHGIDADHRDANAANWIYTHNGRVVDPVRIAQMLKIYYRADMGDRQIKANDMTALLTTDWAIATNSLCDLRYNLTIMQKSPFEVPNPLILNTIPRGMSSNNNIVISNAEGSATTDKENLHNFKHQYIKYIESDTAFADQVRKMKQIVEEFFGMYEHYASNLWNINPLLSASTYMQNNQTELPAMAYHGNLKIDKIKGGQEEVRCVGHLGNSYPGCACIREGKGMVNMFQSLPTPVHVM
jgi:hypothetical protein